MDTILLDTDVTSYIIKDLPIATLFRSIIFGNRVAVSFMTLAEIHEGICRSRAYYEMVWTGIFLYPAFRQ